MRLHKVGWAKNEKTKRIQKKAMKETWFLILLRQKRKKKKEKNQGDNPQSLPKSNFLSFCYSKKTEEFRITIEETETKFYNYNY